QGNRNPYIDHPEFVSLVWGIGMDTQDVNYQTRKDVTVYTTQFNVVVIRLENPENTMEFVSVYDAQGRLIQTKNNTLNQSEIRHTLPQKGVYILKVEGKKLEFNTKVLIK